MASSDAPCILIVDDARATQEILSGILAHDYQVKVASSGSQAIQIGQMYPPPDLILLDVNLPGMDGYEVYRHLKNWLPTRDIPIIFITGANDLASEQKGLELGAADYITKPVNPSITLLRVRNQLLIKASQDKMRLNLKIFEAARDRIVVTDAHRNIVDVNPAFVRITGYSRNETIGKNIHFLESDRQDQSFIAAIWQQVNSKGYWSGELLHIKKSGLSYPEMCSISAITDAYDQVTHYVGVYSDIAWHKGLENN
jgi:PAS domain S-box-containing protein